MKKPNKIITFSISSLIAAGIPMGVQADSAQQEKEVSFLDDIKNIVSEIGDQQIYTLAGHSSHGSHGSHSSHGSHRSGYYKPTEEERGEPLAFLGERNEGSTPRSTILPSSPAINKVRQLKRLPGNSGKFKDTIMRVQVSLSSMGFDVGVIDGELHSRTIAAVYEYQAEHGLIPSGKVTPETLNQLGIITS